MGITESQFYMWRTLFAIVHADNVISSEEIRFMAEALEDIPFSSEQKTVLEEDAKMPGDIDAMYEGITDKKDQMEFFEIARTLVNIDHDFAEEEQEVMLKLKRLHLDDTNVDDLVGQVDLSFEDDGQNADAFPVEEQRGFKSLLLSLRDRFLIKIQGG